MIDSGSIYSLELNASFVKQHDLAHRYPTSLHGYAGEGWGGPQTGLYTRVGKLELGTLSVKRPVTVLLESSQGPTSQLAGTIGLRILNSFVATFDGPEGKLYLEKSPLYQEPEIFNRAGLIVDPNPDNARIRLVFPGSPAADAGLMADDVITEIDGRPPTDESLVSAFARPVGTHLSLTVRRSGMPLRTVSINLRDVL